MKYFKPISISLSPNVEKDDVKLALNLIVRPWFWKRGRAVEELEKKFKEYLGVKYAVSFNSGRSSFYALLKALKETEELKEGDQVLLQAFTCNALPNPVLWAGLEPVYIDCSEDDFNIDISDLKLKIGPKARVLVVQHTFGMPCDMNEVRTICAEKNIVLIEDCAHSLGAEFNGQKVGRLKGYPDRAAFFSFSRDKIISSVYGGIATTNDQILGEKLIKFQKEFKSPSYFWIFQQILHPILLNFIILPVYSFLDLGKVLLIFSQWFNVLSKAVSWQEKVGKKPDYFPKAMPNALAMMAINQFNKLERFNGHRQNVANYYYENLKGSKFELPKRFENRKNAFLRFTVKHSNAHEIIYKAWHQQNMLLGDWYTTPIAPFDTNVKEVKYKPGSCKNAEYLAKKTLNLPTHINIYPKDAERIVEFLKTIDKK